MRPAKHSIIQDLERVIDIEIEALQSLRSNLNDNFPAAVEMIAACKGQVCVTGVGKSGMIAAKIAATLRSTGTPAVFLHAGEALHGDIGMIRDQDILLAVGKSGETAELNSLLRIAKKNGTPVISITSNASSAMAALSNLVLDTKVPKEACHLNLAPTSSTTAALVVGDAIAVALMKLNGVSELDFARHHPGGQLGARLLLKVSDVMRKGEDNPIIGADESIKEMLVKITSFRVGAISIINRESELLGLVTDYDVRRALESGRDLFSMSIAEVMNPRPESILEGIGAYEALEMMRQRSKPTAVLPVVSSENRVVGMLHLHDLISSGL